MNLLENAVIAQALVTDNNLVEICKVKDLVGEKGTLSVSVDNLLRTEKALQLIVTTEEGKVLRLITSGAVGAAIRAKELPLKTVATFPVVEYATKGSGEIIPMVVNPIGSSVLVSIEAKTFDKGEYKREFKGDIKELIAF